MKKILFLFLFVTSCASYTVNGIKVFDRQVETKFTEQEITELIELSIILVRGQNLFEGWDFVFTNAWTVYSMNNKEVIIVPGIADPKDKVIFIKVRECLWDSAIFHEMAHIVRLHKIGDSDREHLDKEFWDDIERLENAVINDNCPYGYKRNDKVPRLLVP